MKKSFGTAIKVWGDDLWANFSTYAKLALLTWLVWNDQGLMQRYRTRAVHEMAERTERVDESVQK